MKPGRAAPYEIKRVIVGYKRAYENIFQLPFQMGDVPKARDDGTCNGARNGISVNGLEYHSAAIHWVKAVWGLPLNFCPITTWHGI